MPVRPDQSVNDLRYHDGNGSIMAFILNPGDPPGDVKVSPDAVVWTPPEE